LCKMASGDERTFCRLNGKEYRLNTDCDMVSKDTGSITINNRYTKKKQSIKRSSHKTPRSRSKSLSRSRSRSRSRKSLTRSRSRSRSRSLSRSYRPTINRDLNSLKSMEREKIVACNLADFKKNIHTKPLQIRLDGQCTSVFEDNAKQYLLKQLSANKHLNLTKMISPKQNRDNCWFNCMFVVLFMSDKGRQFFHYFRTLMILGELSNGDRIPEGLRNGFALLNFNIETCLIGDKGTLRQLNTNDIIKYIHTTIGFYSDYIYKVGHYGNPVRYYMTLVNYLSLKSIRFVKLEADETTTFQSGLTLPVGQRNNLIDRLLGKTPHVVVLTFEDDNMVLNKVLEFEYNGFKYKLDSCCVRDVGKNHYTALLTCNGQDYGFDGDSLTRMKPLAWRHRLNLNEYYHFSGPMRYNFMLSYVMMIYYRVK
jgi:hypothetical protein